MKDTKDIASDCGLNEAQSQILRRALSEGSPHIGKWESELHEIIGALYRRIEKLEEDHVGALRRAADRISGWDLLNTEETIDLTGYRDDLWKIANKMEAL